MLLFSFPEGIVTHGLFPQTEGATSGSGGSAGCQHPSAEGSQAVHWETTRTRILHCWWAWWESLFFPFFLISVWRHLSAMECVFQVMCTRAQWTGSCGESVLTTAWPSSLRWDKIYQNAVGVCSGMTASFLTFLLTFCGLHNFTV